ncbi:MAG: hypothetical protein KY432_02315 [Acidobacteria bacterium]|nr:hypothetical protein [Acidobacteriota bacterium]
MKSRGVCTILVVLVLGCAAGTANSRQAADEHTAPAPPWEGSELSRDQVPKVLIDQWQKAENRRNCAPLGFASLGTDSRAVPRAARFAGGWAVAWDLPDGPGSAASGEYCDSCGRGAFGIAGTGVEPTPDTYDDWEYQETFSDGSRIGYGPREQQWLAYLQIAGQRCLYNIWSYRGREHLEGLIDELRMVH